MDMFWLASQLALLFEDVAVRAILASVRPRIVQVLKLKVIKMSAKNNAVLGQPPVGTANLD